MPFCLLLGRRSSASTTKTSPTVPWVMNILVPLRTQLVALAHRGGLQPGGVGAGAGLGEAPGAQPLAGGELGQVLLLLRLVAEDADVAGAEAVVARPR